MQRTMLEATPTMTTLATETTSADNDVRNASNGDNAGYCDNHSTMTAMHRTMLEVTTTMTTLATATSSAH